MKNVVFVLNELAQQHLQSLLKYFLLSDNSTDVKTYLQRLGKIFQTIDQYYDGNPNAKELKWKLQYEPINRSPYGRQPHTQKYSSIPPKEVGFLSPPLGDCISRNIDETNRFVAFEISKGIIGVVTVLGHYNKNIFNTIDLLDLVNEMKSTYKTDSKGFNELQNNSKTIINSLFSIVHPENNKYNYEQFNKFCKSSILPLEFSGLYERFNNKRESIEHAGNKTIYEIKQEKDSLDQLDKEIYKILKNTINFSYFVTNISNDNKLTQLKNIIPPNKTIIFDYTKNAQLLNKHKDVFNKPIEAIDKTLQACSTALAHSFNFTIDNDLINEFALRFKNEIDYDISLIQKTKDSNPNKELSSEDLILEKTTIFLEEFYNQKIHAQKSSFKIQNDTVNKFNDRKSYFDIPFADREDAKKIGTEWDLDVSCWYVPSGIDLSPFTSHGWRKLTNKEVNEAREQKQAINAKNSSMLDRLQNNISNSNDQRNVQKNDNCIEIPFSIQPNDFKGVEALGAFFDKEKEKWFVPKDPKTIKAVGKYLSKEETAKRRVEEAIACQKRKKEEKLNQQDQKKNKKGR